MSSSAIPVPRIGSLSSSSFSYHTLRATTSTTRGVLSGIFGSRRLVAWSSFSSSSSSSSQQQERHQHSGNNNNKNKNTSGSGTGSNIPDLYAVPFSISPQDALTKFRTWADQEQGLSYILSESSIRLQAAYCPVWSFALNFRFLVVTTDTTTGKQTKRLDWKPTLFQQAYGSSQSIVHIPGVAAYAGYNFRRSLINAVHNTSLIFLQKDIVTFDPTFMLEPLEYITTGKKKERLEINPDPWNATRRRALAVVQDEWQALATEDYHLHHQDKNAQQKIEIQVQTQLVSAQRVYMPTYVVEYRLMGAATYQAMVSGCDQGAAVSGVSHQLWSPSQNFLAYSSSSSQFAQRSAGLLVQAYQTLQTTARILGPRNVGVLAVAAVQVVLTVLRQVLLRIPVIATVVGLWIALRKIIWPYWTHQYATADWEHQRQMEQNAASSAGPIRGDDFVDTTGTAERFFYRHREAILQALQGGGGGGTSDHATGDFDWYDQWMEWARRVYEQEQRGFEQQQQQQTRQQRRQAPKPEYQWDFDPNDPYSVLKISRTATSQEISQAFRREMLKYHPDRMANATEAERARATERSKLISEAYQKLKVKSR